MIPSHRWPAAIIGLIGLNMAIVGATIYFATHDPSAAVEPDYYQKAVDWDADARERARSERLGWTASVELDAPGELSVRLTDRDGHAVAGAQIVVRAFAVARAGDRQTLTCTETQSGRYVAPIAVSRRGLWQFHVDARRAGDHHVSVIERDLGDGASATRVEVRE